MILNLEFLTNSFKKYRYDLVNALKKIAKNHCFYRVLLSFKDCLFSEQKAWTAPYLAITRSEHR